MPKLPRVTAKVFASKAEEKDIGQYGSALTGTKVNTGDIAEIQALPAYETGWRGAVLSNRNYPTLEEMNGLQKTFSQQTAYILETGMPEWDENTTYYANTSFCQVNGVWYKSLTDNNINNNPVNTSEHWSKLDLGNCNNVGQIMIWQGEILPENYTWYGMGQETLRSEYPELYNHVEKYKMITTEENWQAGMQGLYSYGDGETTFRFPLIEDGGVLSFADGVTTLAGQKIDEELPNIKGNIAIRGFGDGVLTYSGVLISGTKINTGGYCGHNQSSGDVNTVNINTSLSSPVYKDGGHVKQNGIAARLIIKYK